MYKEITPREVAKILGEKGKFFGYTRDSEREVWTERCINGVELRADTCPICTPDGWYAYCAIKVESKKRLMTKDECLAWACTEGSSGWQVSLSKSEWKTLGFYTFCTLQIKDYRRRTVKWNDGKPTYGEPEKFEIEVIDD